MGDQQYGRIQGDPDAVAAKAKRYQEIADAIQRSTATLDEIAHQIEQKSLAMDKTRSLARDVSEDITKALGRYRTTGDALVAYAPDLRAAQDKGNPAAERIAQLEQDLSQARTTEWYADQHEQHTTSSSTATPADQDEATRLATKARTHREGVESDLADARTTWQDAEDAKNAAADGARAKIVDVVSGSHVDGLKDSTWDKVKFYAGKVYELFKVVCDIAGVLAIFLAWVPFLGEALLVLAAVGALLSVVEAAVKVAQSGGTSGWGELLFASGMAVLTVFGGKLLALGADAVRGKAVIGLAREVGPSAARATEGIGTELTQAYRTVGSSGGRRLATLLKSPWVRSTAQREMFREFQTSSQKLPAFKELLTTSAKEAFPGNPLKGGAERWLFQNDSVVKLGRMTAEHPDLFTAGMHSQAALLQLGAHANAVFTLGRAGVGVYGAATGGDPVGAITGGLGIGTRPMDGSYGDVVSGVGSVKSLVDITDSMI